MLTRNIKLFRKELLEVRRRTQKEKAEYKPVDQANQAALEKKRSKLRTGKPAQEPGANEEGSSCEPG